MGGFWGAPGEFTRIPGAPGPILASSASIFAGTQYEAVGWRNAGVQDNRYILERWIESLRSERFIHAPGLAAVNLQSQNAGKRANVIERLAESIARAGRIAVLTGAGISTESGLPDFRSKGGLWRTFRPEEIASVDALRRRPLLFYEFYRFRLELLRQAAPNPAHFALAELERQGRVVRVVTQNVDGLHGEAGSRRVSELHGSLRQARCHECGRSHPVDLLEKPVNDLADVPRCACGGLVRPGVVLFGEMLPRNALDEAARAMESCEGVLVVGTSLQVYPAAGLPQVALRRGRPVWIVNLTPTPYDGSAEIVVREKAGEVLPQVAALLGAPKGAETGPGGAETGPGGVKAGPSDADTRPGGAPGPSGAAIDPGGA